MPATTSTNDPLADLHHPHYLGTTTNQDGAVTFQFRPFTGTEPMPRAPWGAARAAGLTEDDLERLDEEYKAASRCREEAQFVHRTGPILRDAKHARDAYQKARTVMDRRFANLAKTKGDRWNATVFELVSEQQAARQAAECWDSFATRVVGQQRARYSPSTDWNDCLWQAARGVGVDITGWFTVDRNARACFLKRSLVEGVDAEICRQQEHLQQVARLTGGQYPPETR